jgi:O6-methylguanine-DNA--protein-cysteine methyltransferase
MLSQYLADEVLHEAEHRGAVARLVEETPPNLRGKTMLKADFIETPIGPMIAVADAHALHILEFLERKALATEVTKLRKATGSAIVFGNCRPIDRIEAELTAYFAGKKAVFETRLAPLGTPFERQVWETLRKIPAGETTSYSGVGCRHWQSGRSAVCRPRQRRQSDRHRHPLPPRRRRCRRTDRLWRRAVAQKLAHRT